MSLVERLRKAEGMCRKDEAVITEAADEIERLLAVVDAATNLVRAQGKQIDECWQVLDDAVDALREDEG